MKRLKKKLIEYPKLVLISSEPYRVVDLVSRILAGIPGIPQKKDPSKEKWTKDIVFSHHQSNIGIPLTVFLLLFFSLHLGFLMSLES